MPNGDIIDSTAFQGLLEDLMRQHVKDTVLNVVECYNTVMIQGMKVILIPHYFSNAPYLAI